MKWNLIHWDDCAVELEWVVVEVGNKSVLRRLTKDGDDNALIYVDQALMSVLKVTPGGPQDAGQVSARWRRTCGTTRRATRWPSTGSAAPQGPAGWPPGPPSASVWGASHDAVPRAGHALVTRRVSA
ncbi:hypothetical protein AB0O01_12045 [Streptomyces sp. NPDC093252]|uniref:hypothetical protein n=1 Tax=Streptomyces sp. NPDC093252 TaxID=3154980 RepID=UPI00344A9012